MPKTLFTPPMPELKSERQQYAYDRTAGEGITDVQLGIALHVRHKRLCACRTGDVCEWAQANGHDVLTALRKKLKDTDYAIVRRRSGLWQRVNGPAGAGPGEDIPF